MHENLLKSTQKKNSNGCSILDATERRLVVLGRGLRPIMFTFTFQKFDRIRDNKNGTGDCAYLMGLFINYGTDYDLLHY
jgi:hypothetical protein